MKTPNPYDFTGDFYQVFKKKNKNSLQNIPENRREGNIFQLIL